MCFYKAFAISILHHQATAYKLTWRSLAEALLKKKADIRKSSKWILSSCIISFPMYNFPYRSCPYTI
ncbi:hypothetical protein DWW36_18040 [Erysipelotrichaceae bacterium AF15-26LB]|nr:hypothetical protein DWX45_20065 [Erysipelotrichaceae bacterium AF19-24AC]RJV83599.1 hypothetical protein DWW36_18040 [Erysipelotrichaceae bacterium AF15-26LB]